MNVNAMRKSLGVFSLATLAFLTAEVAHSQVVVNMTAQRSSLALPDGMTVPMWGFCSTACSSAWAPGPTIVVPVGQNLEIDLINKLPTSTSIVILGQIGGGLGSPSMVASPTHATQTQTTWPSNSTATVPFVPPVQLPRVQSFGSETVAGGTGKYTWSSMKAGTYLYETGTNPSIQVPMGLYGVIVVTTAPSTSATPGKAYPGSFPNSSLVRDASYDMDAVMLLSEIDIT